MALNSNPAVITMPVFLWYNAPSAKGGVVLPRAARKHSATGIYHVVLRGMNRQVIFEEEADYHRWLCTMASCKEKSKFELYAL